MSNYKLYYFPFKARAEPIRLLFAYKGIKYEDIRLPYGHPFGTPREVWLEFKPSTPFGVLPVLEEDGGKRVGGSVVILRYLGEKEGLAGANAWENAQLGAVSDYLGDLYKAMNDIYFEKNKIRKAELEEKMNNETGPKYLGKLNEMAAKDGYLYNGRLTWVDLQFYCIFEVIFESKPEVANSFSNLMKLKALIEADPNIAKWLAERPKTAV